MVELPTQSYELRAVDELTPYTDNPRRGNLDMIRESVEVNGWFGAIVVQQSTGRILIGNHRYLAAKNAGATELPVLVADVDDERAQRWMIADNRHAELAEWDEDVLAELLSELKMTDHALAGTGFTDADLDRLRIDDIAPDDDAPHRLDQRSAIECPQCGYSWRIGADGEPVDA